MEGSINKDYPIITQFEPPAGLSPTMAGFLVDGMFSLNDFWAGFLELYTKDIISIEEIKKGDTDKIIGYKATLQKNIEEINDLIEREIIFVFFDSKNPQKGDSQNLWERYLVLSPSTKQGRVRAVMIFANLKKIIEARMIELYFWKENPYPHMKWRNVWKRSLRFLMYVYLISIPFGIYWWITENFGNYVMIFGVFFLFFIFPLSIFFNFMLHPFIASAQTVKARGAARTEKGEETQRHLLGFVQYVRVAEKERILFHYKNWTEVKNNPKEFLYAVALGVVQPYYLFLSSEQEAMREYARTA